MIIATSSGYGAHAMLDLNENAVTMMAIVSVANREYVVSATGRYPASKLATSR